ncbi:hypothetical protein BgiBS90_015991, partial [Biomphalaria glabrata]
MTSSKLIVSMSAFSVPSNARCFNKLLLYYYGVFLDLRWSMRKRAQYPVGISKGRKVLNSLDK